MTDQSAYFFNTLDLVDQDTGIGQYPLLARTAREMSSDFLIGITVKLRPLPSL